MLKFVAGEKGLSGAENLDAFKKHLKEEKTIQWLEKPLHGRFLKDTEKMSTERMWQWLKVVHPKKETGDGVCSTWAGTTGKLDKTPYVGCVVNRVRR